MFDLSRLTETLTGLAGALSSQAPEQSGGLIEALQQIGVDPSALAGLSETELTSMLSDLGIDPAQFGAGEIGELLAGFDIGPDLTSTGVDFVAGLLGRDGIG